MNEKLLNAQNERAFRERDRELLAGNDAQWYEELSAALEFERQQDAYYDEIAERQKEKE